MLEPLFAWPVMRDDPLQVEDIKSRQPSTLRALNENPDLMGLEVMIWRHPENAAIVSNRIRWVQIIDGQLGYRNVAHYDTSEIRAIMDLTQGSSTASIQEVAKLLPAKTPVSDAEAGWISCTLTRHGILLSNPGVRKIGKDPVWREAARREAEIPAAELHDMAENGLHLSFGGQLATLVSGLRQDVSNHQNLVEHASIKSMMEMHIARTCELIPKDRHMALHPRWSPISPL